MELHGAEEPGVEAIMGREVERSRQYHAEELDALGSWSGEALVRPEPYALIRLNPDRILQLVRGSAGERLSPCLRLLDSTTHVPLASQCVAQAVECGGSLVC